MRVARESSSVVPNWSASEWTWLSRGCRRLKAAGPQLPITLTQRVSDSGGQSPSLSVLRCSLSEGHRPSL